MQIQPELYRGPVFHPGASLVKRKSKIEVVQHTNTAPTKWIGTPVIQTTGNPYNDTYYTDGFNRGENGTSTLGQSFITESAFVLEQISLYAGDGFGTTQKEYLSLAIYDLGPADEPEAGSYTESQNLLESSADLYINYSPQAPGILQLYLDESIQPQLRAGHRYLLEIQGIPGSAPLFWRRSVEDLYAEGAAYRNGEMIHDDSGSKDFGMALYGKSMD